MDVSLSDHLGGQLRRLCAVAEIPPAEPLELLRGLLGGTATRSLADPPAWPSDVADDHSPVEFSVAFNPPSRPRCGSSPRWSATRPACTPT